MARASHFLALALALCGQAAAAREAVWASEPQDVSVTIYRDPNRREGAEIDRDWPRGFALISETRTVTLPPGESTIRFDGVSEGMIAVSAIVTGLPGGTIEKNRNADLLSPAALVDGTLGNRVTITRTNPATGVSVSQEAIVRTRADGGLVLQTGEGYEAVRCSGLPEKLAFDRVPDGLSAQPVFSIDTRDPAGGTYEIVLTYLSWGFDWQAHYVATFQGRQSDGNERLAMRSWLTLLNDNGQSFENAQLLAVAGKINLVSDFEALAEPPEARDLYLTCYPFGSTAAGSPYYSFGGPPPPPPSAAPMGYFGEEDSVIVTGMRISEAVQRIPAVMLAQEEQLGDLKLYRVPEPVTVAAQSLKQVAFLDKDKVEGKVFYRADCAHWNADDNPFATRRVLETVNDEEHGLDVSMPMGGITMFEARPGGDLLVGEQFLRDYARGQDVDIYLADSSQVFATCTAEQDIDPQDEGLPWAPMKATITNANPWPVELKLRLGWSSQWRVREKLRGLALEDGQWTLTRTIPANRAVEFAWSIGYIEAEDFEEE